jgi:hypothetical protein
VGIHAQTRYHNPDTLFHHERLSFDPFFKRVFDKRMIHRRGAEDAEFKLFFWFALARRKPNTNSLYWQLSEPFHFQTRRMGFPLPSSLARETPKPVSLGSTAMETSFPLCVLCVFSEAGAEKALTYSHGQIGTIPYSGKA